MPSTELKACNLHFPNSGKDNDVMAEVAFDDFKGWGRMLS
jgi:hypothetical protein